MIDPDLQAALGEMFGVSPSDVPDMLRTGEQFQESLLSGEFDNSAVGQAFGSWFSTRPQREYQRATFVHVALTLGCQQEIVADRLLSVIGAAMASTRPDFGSRLSDLLDELIVQDPPASPADVENHRRGQEAFLSLKSWLRSQDTI